MVRVMIADDELFSVVYLESMLSSIKGVSIVGKYSNTDEIEASLNEGPVDILFLEIELPGEGGLSLARKLRASHPHLHIVFVTAYEQFAVEAFDIGVSGYLLKPVQKERMHQIMDYITKGSIQKKKDDVMIRCFGKLSFMINGQKVNKINWRTTKSKEIFLYLLQNRDELVLKTDLANRFWPKLPERKRLEVLYSNIYYVRLTLKAIEVPIEVINVGNCYKIELHDVKTDVNEWRQIVAYIDQINVENISIFEEAASLYTGKYLKKEAYQWAKEKRENVSLIHKRFLIKLVHFLSVTGKHDKALFYTKKLQALYPDVKDLSISSLQNNNNPAFEHVDSMVQL